MVSKVGVSLITQTFTSDAIGQRIPTDSIKTVFGNKRNVNGTEINEAGQRGIQAAFVVDVWSVEYNGAVIVSVNGVKYNVYRTFENQKNGMTELYLERRV